MFIQSPRAILVMALFSIVSSIVGCGNFGSTDFSSRGVPVTAEPTYYGTPVAVTNPLTITVPAKFLFRKLDYTPGSSDNGLGDVSTPAEALPIPFAEFHIYDSSGTRVQQGETTTDGLAVFDLPKVAGNFTLKVFSRAFNNYLKISVLEDIYANSPYGISFNFTITSAHTANSTLDLSSTPLYAQAHESVSSKIEGGAFNIYYQMLLANEYIRRNIGKNGDTPGVPSSDTNKWWVAEKVQIYWKAGFNPYSYFNSTAPLSFYTPGEKKLYILGGVSGDVKSSDTDHFDDSIILHEYAHFLEDVYAHSSSPGGSHNGDSIIDPRLAWSEGWANYFQAAVLTGADAHASSAAENRIPAIKRFHYYVDTYGYKGNQGSGVSIAFNLAAVGTLLSEPDTVGTDSISDTGLFREVSISRTLYKTSRATSESYSLGKPGGGVSFTNFWKAFAGEDTANANRNSPLAYSLRKSASFPLANAGIFHWLLGKHGVNNIQWTQILDEENQAQDSQDYGFLLSPGVCDFSFPRGIMEQTFNMGTIPRSHQQLNNDFFIYYHNGNSDTLSMDFTSVLNLDLILYYLDYVYFEDVYWYAGRTSTYVARHSRSASSSTESISLAGLPAGYYVLNVKINAYNKTNAALDYPATYKLFKNGSTQLCGTEQ